MTSNPHSPRHTTASLEQELPMSAERLARMSLACVSEPGDLALRNELRLRGAVATWQRISQPANDVWGRRAAAFDVATVRRSADAAGLRFIIPGDPEWPSQVDDLDHGEAVAGLGGAPLGLWVRGDQVQLRRLRECGISMVGSRASTSYGDRASLDMAAEFVERGWVVVSGGAYGIDAAAHRGALAAGGQTGCVLACGLDRTYPRAHEGLLSDIAAHGVVVGELPPGAHPMRSRFLGRNRLIAALTAGTVVVEAAMRSGARNTVSWAESLSRPVLAVPGPVHSANSWTPHSLIRTRAAELVTSAAEVIDHVSAIGQQMLPMPPMAPDNGFDLLPATAQVVFDHLPSDDGLGPELLVAASGLSLAAVTAALDELAARGMVRRLGDRWWIVPGTAG